MRAFGRWMRDRRTGDGSLAELAPADFHCLQEIGKGAARALVRKGLADLAWCEEHGSFALIDGEVFGTGETREPSRKPDSASAILHAFRKDGAAAFVALNGNAAIMLWDAESGRLALAADRSGYGLCFWMESRGAIFFGSDILSLIRNDPRTDLNEAAIDLFLASGFISSPWTSLAHIHKVPAGHVLIAERSNTTLSSYWRPRGRPRVRLPSEQIKHLQERAVLQAVERQLPGSAKPALLLSSGIDSMYLAAVLVRKFSVRPFAFTYRYADYQGQFNESEGARAAAWLLRLEHREIMVGLDDILSNLRSMLIAHSGPFSYGAHSAILRDVAASGAQVLYNGLEPDAPYCSISELIGQRLRALPLPHGGVANAFERVFGRERRWARAVATAERMAATGLVWRFHAPLSPDSVRRSLYLDPGRVGRSKQACALLFAETIKQYDGEEAVVRVGGPLNRLYSSEGSNRWSACFGRAHGLLPRSPLLDSDYIDLAYRLPWHPNKRVLRELAAQLLGPELAWSPKIGQTLPVSQWLRGPLAGRMAGELSQERIAAGGIFRHEIIEDLITRHRTGAGSHAWTVWNVLMITLWQEVVREEAGTLAAARRGTRQAGSL